VEEGKIITIPGMGDVSIRKSRRAIRLSITVTGDGAIRVTVPPRATLSQAKVFLSEKADWVAKQRERACRLHKQRRELTARLRPLSREEATEILCRRLTCLADKFGFSYNKLTIRRQKTRWGSCSGRNNISLNEKLAWLPGRLMDYVLLHELVHTRIKNHGEEFWQELGKYVDDVGPLRRELRHYHPGLF